MLKWVEIWKVFLSFKSNIFSWLYSLHLVESNSHTGEVIFVAPDKEEMPTSEDGNEGYRDEDSSGHPSKINACT